MNFEKSDGKSFADCATATKSEIFAAKFFDLETNDVTILELS